MTFEQQLPAKHESFQGTDLLPKVLDVQLPSTDVVGYENVEAEDMVLPVLKCLQGMSPEVTEHADKGARAGKFFLSSTQRVFDGVVKLLIVQHHRSRALFPDERNPRHAGLERCLSADAIKGTKYGYCSDCEHAEWGADREPPVCSLSHNFIVATEDGPAILRFNRTSLKAGKDFISACKFSIPPKPLWAHPTILRSVAATSKINGKDVTYYKMSISWDRSEPTAGPLQVMAKALYSQVHAAFEAGKIATADETVVEEKPAKKTAQEEFDDKIPF